MQKMFIFGCLPTAVSPTVESGVCASSRRRAVHSWASPSGVFGGKNSKDQVGRSEAVPLDPHRLVPARERRLHGGASAEDGGLDLADAIRAYLK